jgi:hypothetical protein
MPFAGKSELATERARTLGGIYARHGARVRVARTIAGADAERIRLYIMYDNGTSMGQIWEKCRTDPSLVKLLQEREVDPEGSLSGPAVYRTVYGQMEPDYPVVQEREYAMSRDKVADALALMPGIEALGKGLDIKIAATVPVFSNEMNRLTAVYFFRSLAQMGTAMDGIYMSAEFQSIVTEAAAFGSLTKSRIISSM